MKAVRVSLLLLALVGCTTRLYIPTAANVDKVEKATLAELNQGHDLFQSKCGKCHRLPKPPSRDAVKWNKVLGIMALKAKLTADQKDLVYKYLVNN